MSPLQDGRIGMNIKLSLLADRTCISSKNDSIFIKRLSRKWSAAQKTSNTIESSNSENGFINQFIRLKSIVIQLQFTKRILHENGSDLYQKKGN